MSSEWEIDQTGTVEQVIDGDTFLAIYMGRVRLADIDAPEIGEPGAREATDYLDSLILPQVVYLDVDDVHGVDRYNRVVAVVYVRHNSTHLLNVNEALLRAGLAVVIDFPNEFDPATWT
ncbi:MAG: thermonuclease family protein, partial [Thermoplasmata archaeon]